MTLAARAAIRGRCGILRDAMHRVSPGLATRLLAAVGVASLLASCGDAPRGTPVAAHTSHGGLVSFGGDARSPVNGRDYLFTDGQPAVAIQAGSRTLVAAIGSPEGLAVKPLETTPDTAGVMLLEETAEGREWGEVLFPAESKVFGAFTDDANTGEWLVLVADVYVRGLQDPIPPTAYRWSRADVEAYADCGIPARGRDECSEEFFAKALKVVLAWPGGMPRGA